MCIQLLFVSVIILILGIQPSYGDTSEYQCIDECYGDISELCSILINNNILLSDICKTDYYAILSSKKLTILTEKCKSKCRLIDSLQSFSILDYERFQNNQNDLVRFTPKLVPLA